MAERHKRNGRTDRGKGKEREQLACVRAGEEGGRLKSLSGDPEQVGRVLKMGGGGRCEKSLAGGCGSTHGTSCVSVG